jgi:flagellar P-ring protein precursor FlgI
MTRSIASLSFFLLLASSAPAEATRIQELCDVRGVRTNQLTGYGLVVGLNNTGDMGQSRFTVQSTAAMLRRLGATIDPAAIQTRNAAAVVVTANLPPFAAPGTRIDVTVSSLGNARSLMGGTLVQTPLYGGDRRVYAVAHGPLIVGGFQAAGRTGSMVMQNHVTTGRIPNGAIIERATEMPGLRNDAIVLSLRSPNFVTAQRIADAINQRLGDTTAAPLDSGSVRVKVPENYRQNVVGLLAEVHVLEVEPNIPARVVIDERTGTVVLGAGVRIGQAAVAQGGLTVEIAERFDASQPNALGLGRTAVLPDSEVRASSRAGRMQLLPASADLTQVVDALNALGARPRDLIAIFQALHKAGALQADLEVQ